MGVQTDYNFNMDKASEGLIADCGFRNCLTMRALENIPVGRGIVKVLGQDAVCRLPGQNLTTVVLDGDLVTDNIVRFEVNGTVVGVQTSIINFDDDFVTSNSIVATVDGNALSPVLFNTDQPTTIADLATEIGGAANVASATVTGARQITVVFDESGDHEVDSVVTSSGATQPTADIGTGSVIFATSHLATMQAIADQIRFEPGIDSVTVGGANNRTLFVNAILGGPVTVDSFTISLGATQASETITDSTNDTFYGVAVREQAKENQWSPGLGSNGPNPYFAGEAVSVLTRGRVYVFVDQDVTSDDPVYMRIKSGAGESLIGRFRADADGSDAVLVADARYIEGAEAGGLAVLEFNKP